MRAVEVPELTEDFTADPVELFFDLAYVFAFSQLVGILITEHTWAGVGRVALLFGLLWLPWQQLTWAANAVSGNGRPVRLAFLVATVVSVPMAAATSTALEGGGLIFALSLTGIMLIGFWVQSIGAVAGDNLDSILRWMGPNLAAMVTLIAGALLEGQTRITVWLMSLAIVLAAMIFAGKGDWIIRAGHFAERHALIVIVALGEVIVAIGIPVVAALQTGESLDGSTVTALLASGAFAGLLWWAYFDRPSPGLEHRAGQIESPNERGRFVRDVYTWAHAPIVAGIILSAAALEEIALHPNEVVDISFRSMLAGGLALSIFGVAIAVWRAYRAIASERLLAGVLLAGLVFMGSSLRGVVLLVLVVVAIFVALVIEHRRVESSMKFSSPSPS